MENMISVPLHARVDQPLEDEVSRTLPDQIGNVAGAHSRELHQRLLETGGRMDTLGPLKKVYVFWLPGMSCDGCTVSTIGATEPSIEELLTGALPGVPVMVLHHYQFEMESGDHFTYTMEQAEAGALDAPYIIVYEGSITDENLTVGAEPFAVIGSSLPAFTPAQGRQRRSTPEWVRRLARGAAVTIAIGTCATWGGIPAAVGNPTGAMSMMDFLGKDYRSVLGVPVVNVPGCPPIGDNFNETVAAVLYFLQGFGPLPEFDELGRPAWLFGETVHRRCVRGAYYEEGVFAEEFGDPECLVEIGCWGPVVNCNITSRGMINHVGGCMNAGGACIGCTMPGFPDKFTPFYKRPPGSLASTTVSRMVGSVIRPLRKFSNNNLNREVRWDRQGATPSAFSREKAEPSPLADVGHKFYDKMRRANDTGQNDADVWGKREEAPSGGSPASRV